MRISALALWSLLFFTAGLPYCLLYRNATGRPHIEMYVFNPQGLEFSCESGATVHRTKRSIIDYLPISSQGTTDLTFRAGQRVVKWKTPKGGSLKVCVSVPTLGIWASYSGAESDPKNHILSNREFFDLSQTIFMQANMDQVFVNEQHENWLTISKWYCAALLIAFLGFAARQPSKRPLDEPFWRAIPRPIATVIGIFMWVLSAGIWQILIYIDLILLASPV